MYIYIYIYIYITYISIFICIYIDMPRKKHTQKNSYSVQKSQSFFRIVGTVEQIGRTSFNFTFSTTAE